MTTSKKERNDIIRTRWESGITQSALAKEYGLTQARVSALIHGIMPTRRYCKYCYIRSEGGRVCPSCHAKALIRMKERHEAVVARRAEKALRYCKECKALLNVSRKKRCAECNAINIHKSDAKTKCVQCGSITFNARKLCGVCAPYAESVYLTNPKGRELTRSMVRARDKYTCQDCGTERTREEVKKHNNKFKTGKGKIKSLDVHHLGGKCGKNSIGYDRLEEMPNLITLCHQCHYNHPEHSKKSKMAWSL